MVNAAREFVSIVRCSLTGASVRRFDARGAQSFCFSDTGSLQTKEVARGAGENRGEKGMRHD